MKKELNQLFNSDSNRFSKLNLKNDFLLVDFSKNHIESLALISDSEKIKIEIAREKMFSGAEINHTEHRSAMHFRLRKSKAEDSLDNEVLRVRKDFMDFGDEVFQMKVKGFTGKVINTVVNIGIGGSDLGPKFLVDALRDYGKTVKVKFVSNIDGQAIYDVLEEIDPETTIFIVCSKTFSTQETIQNANTAKKWIIEKLGNKAVPEHFVAVSSNIHKAQEFGIVPSKIFGFWDWVGGRFSLWSAIGLSLVCSIGAKGFQELLDGAECADRDFQKQPMETNIPVLLAAIDHLYFQKLGFQTKVLAPYSHRLSLLVPFLQQLVMESNGKGIYVNGEKISRSGVVWWGAAGTDAQHSFFQLLHQGTENNHVEFVGVIHQPKSPKEHQSKLLSNLLAQSRALMIGEQSNTPEKYFSGNRPSTTILLKEINPKTLGYLVATYEHRVLCEAALLNLNPFDQFGVELGKKLCNDLLPLISNNSQPFDLDSSTVGLIQYLHSNG